MRIIKYSFIASLLLITLFPVTAQITITESGNDIIVNFTLPSYQIKDTIDTDLFGSTVYKYIDIDDFGIIADEGFPELPQLTIDLAVDNNTFGYSVATSNLVVTESTLNHPVYPSQDFEVDDDLIVLPIIDSVYYQSNGSAYDFRYALTDSFSIMGVKGVSVTIFPFVYVPNQNKLKIMTSGTFTLSYYRTSSAKSVPELSSNKADFLSQIFANYTSGGARSTGSSAPEKYLIIAPEMFISTLTYFANYKRNIGYDVSVVSTGSNNKATKTDINNILYGFGQKDYVLLVGDVNVIAASGGTEGDGSDKDNPLTDLHYTGWNAILGIKPFVFLGRWPVIDTDELKNIINKTIYMETCMSTFEKKAVLFSGKRVDNSKSEKRVEKESAKSIDIIAEKPFSKNGWVAEKYHGKDGADAQDMQNALSSDCLYFVYSGHGGNTAFSILPKFSYFVASNINNATNIRYPMVFSSGCLTGNYGYSGSPNNECIGESWIRSQKGGVSFFGPSVNTYLNPASIIERGVLGAVSSTRNLSTIIALGKRKYTNNFWRLVFAANRVTRHMEMYNLFGDPSFKLSGIDSYANLVLAADDVIPLGGKVTYSATESITNEGSFVIDPGAEVEFTAGESIVLMPGFVAEAGSKFTAEIKPVTQSRSIRVTPEEREEFLEIIAAENETVIANNYACCVFPNPVTDMAIVRLEAPEPCSVSIYVYDAGGIPVQSLQNQEMDNTVQFFNLPFDGQPRGVYLYRIVAGKKQYEGKIIKL